MKYYLLLIMMGSTLYAGKIAYIEDARKEYNQLRADKLRLDYMRTNGIPLHKDEKRKKMHELARKITQQAIHLNEHRRMHKDKSVKRKELRELLDSIEKYGKPPFLSLNISL